MSEELKALLSTTEKLMRTVVEAIEQEATIKSDLERERKVTPGIEIIKQPEWLTTGYPPECGNSVKQCELQLRCPQGHSHCCCECKEPDRAGCICTNVAAGAEGECGELL